MSRKISVLGAGAIGLSIAYELARRGNVVTLIERDRLLTEALEAASTDRSASSWAASGILPPANLERATDPIDRLRGFSHQLFPQWVDGLRSLTQIDPKLERCGGWYLADTVGESAAMAGMVSYWSELGIDCRHVTLDELSEREPALSAWANATPSAKAWWVPDEYQIHTPSYLRALTAACKQFGVEILDGHSVDDVEDRGDHVQVKTRSDRGTARDVEAEQAVVCGGVWSGRFGDLLRLARSLVPVRGQILLLKTESRILQGVINCGHRYLVPRDDGYVLVGSSEEEVGIQHGTTPAILSDLRAFARRLCPLLESAREMAAWSGLRPLTFDGFPICGKLPGSEAIYVATGHFRSGIHLSPATAVCLADLMSGRQPPVDIAPFGVGKQQQIVE